MATDAQPSQDASGPPSNKSINISNALSSVLAEEKERSKRQLNLIVHNLDEASGDDALSQKQYDTQRVSEFFQYLGVKATINNAIRLGKKKDKSRLLRVTVNSDKEKAAILRTCTRLRDDSTPSNFQNVYIRIIRFDTSTTTSKQNS